MNRLYQTLLLFTAILTMITVLHSGKTDSKGGHRDSSTGEYHYHHGYPAHQHYDMDGDGKRDCPYNFNNNVDKKDTASDTTPSTAEKTPFILRLLEIIFNATALSVLLTIIIGQVFVFFIDLRTHDKLIWITFVIAFVLSLILQVII